MTENSIARLWTFADGTIAPDAPPPVTDDQLRSFADRFPIKLPATFIELYRQQNGGFSERHLSSFWSIERGQNNDITSLQVLANNYHEDPDLEAEWRLYLGDLSRVIVMLGDGHFYFVLNYNDLHKGQPTVWYVADSVVRSTSMTFADWLFSDGGGRITKRSTRSGRQRVYKWKINRGHPVIAGRSSPDPTHSRRRAAPASI